MCVKKLISVSKHLSILLLMLSLACTVHAQNLQIKGKVTDENGSSLPGASVVIKNLTTGTMTDANGNFTLSVPSRDEVLTVSYLGYNSYETIIGTRDFLEVQLTPNNKQLNEV